MSTFTREVTPSLGTDGAIRISRSEINEYVLNHVKSDFDWFQAVFKPFNYMTINRNGKYTITGVTGSSRFLRKYTGCVIYSYNGASKTSSRSIDSCPMYMLDHMCHDDYIAGCYEHLLNYSSDGELPTMTDEGQRLFDLFIRNQARDYNMSTHLTLALGNAFPNLEAMLSDDIDYETRENLLHGQEDSCDGWFTQWDYMAQSDHPHLNVSGVINPGEFGAGCDYAGDIFETIKKLICEAKPKLRDMIDYGNFNTPTEAGDQAQIWLDRDYYSAVIQAYEKQCQMPAQNCELIVRREVTAMGMTKHVYYIKGMPVICVSPVSGLNPYLKGKLRFIAIVVNGTVQLGNSIGDLYESEGGSALDQGAGLRLKKVENYQVPNLDKNGKFKSMGLIPEAYLTSKFVLSRTVIVDPECIVGAYAYDTSGAKTIEV